MTNGGDHGAPSTKSTTTEKEQVRDKVEQKNPAEKKA